MKQTGWPWTRLIRAQQRADESEASVPARNTQGMPFATRRSSLRLALHTRIGEEAYPAGAALFDRFFRPRVP
jgi:hypothetical protein